MSVTVIKPTDVPALRRARPAAAASFLAGEAVATEPSLPRHLLVSLAGITADVTALQQRSADATQTQAALGAILRKLDRLVDSIYERAASPVAPSLQHPGSAALAPSNAPSGVTNGSVHPVTPALPAHPPGSTTHSLSHPLHHDSVDHGRRQSWVSVSESEH